MNVERNRNNRYLDTLIYCLQTKLFSERRPLSTYQTKHSAVLVLCGGWCFQLFSWTTSENICEVQTVLFQITDTKISEILARRCGVSR